MGAYLQGSFAVGDFDRHSDVDFAIAVREELSEEHVNALQALHERVYGLGSAWAQHLEGSYFPLEILRDYRQRAATLWYLDHGSRSLVRSDHCNTLVVRWVVRERGITLAGPSPATLVEPIPVEALRQEMGETMRRWGEQILDHPDPYRNRFYQGFIVLNYCRMLHDLVEGRPGSKRAGAEWAKEHLDRAWSALIDRAWDTRPNPAVAVRERPDPADFEMTLQFVKAVLRESERVRRTGAFGEHHMTQADISGIAPFFIVRNVPAALSFYRNRLGFDVTFQGPDADDIFFGIVQRGAAMIMLKDVGIEPLPNHTRDSAHGWARWDAYVHVPDPDALAAEFSSRNVEFFQPLKDDDDGLRGFEIEDADGYVLFFGHPRGGRHT